MSESTDGQDPTRTETVTFGAGCFWHVEDEFRQLDGVLETAVGYAGGHTDNPTYEQVCTGTTGHTEVAQITFDPERIGFEEILGKYFEIHDPTQLNRQGPDVGSQYRSVIFAEDERQSETARKVLERVQPRFREPIVTAIEPAARFWRAEEYHQCYLEKREASGGVLRTLLGG